MYHRSPFKFSFAKTSWSSPSSALNFRSFSVFLCGLIIVLLFPRVTTQSCCCQGTVCVLPCSRSWWWRGNRNRPPSASWELYAYRSVTHTHTHTQLLWSQIRCSRREISSGHKVELILFLDRFAHWQRNERSVVVRANSTRDTQNIT